MTINHKLVRSFPGKGDLYEGNFISCTECGFIGTMAEDIDMVGSEVIVMCPDCCSIIGTVPQSAVSV